MAPRNEKDLAGIVSADGRLSALIRASRMFDELDRRLQPQLPESLRGKVQVACVDEDVLVIAAASSAWASRARLEAPNMLEAAREIWPQDLRNWRVIVSQR